jgi:hypothetical protein
MMSMRRSLETVRWIDNVGDAPRAISGHTLGLVFGGFLASWHLAWAGLVLVGWAQAAVDLIFWLHFIEPPYRVEAFVLSRAIGLVAVTGAIGYVMGHVVAGLWNATRGCSASKPGTDRADR